jgi:hypothetical protein
MTVLIWGQDELAYLWQITVVQKKGVQLQPDRGATVLGKVVACKL